MNTDWEHHTKPYTAASIDTLSADNTGILTLNDYTAMRFCGPKNREFLQGQFTCDMNNLTPEQAIPGACCDNKGRVLANGYFFQEEADILFWLPQSLYASLAQHLNVFAPFSRVTISEICNSYIQLGVIGQDKPPALGPTTHVLSLPGHPRRYVQIAPLAATQALWEQSMQVNIPAVTHNAWALANTLGGYCTILPETTGQLLPQMISLHEQEAVSFTKGCYVGQEIIARTQHLGTLKRTLQTVRYGVTEHTVPGSAIIHQDQQKVGVIINSALTTEGTLALAVIQSRALDTPLFVNGHPVTIMG